MTENTPDLSRRVERLLAAINATLALSAPKEPRQVNFHLSSFLSSVTGNLSEDTKALQVFLEKGSASLSASDANASPASIQVERKRRKSEPVEASEQHTYSLEELGTVLRPEACDVLPSADIEVNDEHVTPQTADRCNETPSATADAQSRTEGIDMTAVTAVETPHSKHEEVVDEDAALARAASQAAAFVSAKSDAHMHVLAAVTPASPTSTPATPPHASAQSTPPKSKGTSSAGGSGGGRGGKQHPRHSHTSPSDAIPSPQPSAQRRLSTHAAHTPVPPAAARASLHSSSGAAAGGGSNPHGAGSSGSARQAHPHAK